MFAVLAEVNYPRARCMVNARYYSGQPRTTDTITGIWVVHQIDRGLSTPWVYGLLPDNGIRRRQEFYEINVLTPMG